MEYKKLLEKAISEMPASVHESERFEIPKVMGKLEGNKTIISNFHQIAVTLRRDVAHLLKYILKELATPGEFVKNRLIIGSKVPASRINEKIKSYALEFVICPDCGKPDTKLEKEGDLTYLKCQACGAKRFVKSKI